jgi:chemotaxis protein MotB
MIMNLKANLIFILVLILGLSSCVSKKKFTSMEESYKQNLELANKQLGDCGVGLNEYMNRLANCESNLKSTKTALELRQEQINDLKAQLEDVKSQRDKQITQVEDLAVLTQSANENIKQTLSQMEKKDRYIHLLQAAKSKSDSMNLALAFNLKGVLKEGIEDRDIEIKVDKTVVFINLSDKMLYQSGSSNLTIKAHEVLKKIALIIESRPDMEVMVEGYTDNDPIETPCLEDNWDLSVKRATSVVRVLQKYYKVDPNRLIAAGRGEYNTLASNDTAEGKATNRRTRIIIMPKLNQFYDLLGPNAALN